MAAQQQLQQVKKMSNERLMTKLVAFGYDQELVWTWERDQLLKRYVEVILAGGKPKPVIPVVDSELEKQRLAFEMRKWEQEIKWQKQTREKKERKEQQMREKQREEQQMKEEKERELEQESCAIAKITVRCT